MAGIGDGHNGGGPIWAIFDADAVAREKWQPQPPHVDIDAGFFFAADSSTALAAQDRDEIPARADAAAESRRHRRALQFDSSTPARMRISASRCRSTRSQSRHSMRPGRRRCIHDTRAGLRINARCQVIDMNGEVIPGLYCGGEVGRAASACTACRARFVRASSPARTPPQMKIRTDVRQFGLGSADRSGITPQSHRRLRHAAAWR